MKNKKVYIGISAIALVIICAVASIFYIKTRNKDVETAEFVKANENTKEAMISKEESSENQEEITNEEVENVEEVNEEENEAKIEEKNEKKATENKVVAKKEFTVTDVDKTMYVTASSLNVREGPETTYSKIGSLSYTSEVTITGIVDNFGWYRISYNNKVGYVDGSYLSDTQPVIETKTSSANEVSAVNSLIVINSRNNTLRFYVDGQLSQSYSCATGASSSQTPQGKCQVVQKIVDRPYYKAGIAGGDPSNPLGRRWMGLNLAGTSGSTYGIHGTNNESSIGSNASHGCIRMHNADVEYFYDFVSIGTTVIIKNTSQSDKEIAAEYGIYIE
jgi:lipoprotein-anchoring transpeptidase ErfK/SrfK